MFNGRKARANFDVNYSSSLNRICTICLRRKSNYTGIEQHGVAVRVARVIKDVDGGITHAQNGSHDPGNIVSLSTLAAGHRPAFVSTSECQPAFGE